MAQNPLLPLFGNAGNLKDIGATTPTNKSTLISILYSSFLQKKIVSIFCGFVCGVTLISHGRADKHTTRLDTQQNTQCRKTSVNTYSITINKKYKYDELSDQGYTSLPKPVESECGQMVSEKVYLTYFDVYLSQLM